MRKLLLIIAIILLLVLGCTSLVNGVAIGKFHIYSIKELDENSKTLNQKVQEADTVISTEYPKKVDELMQANQKMQDTKKRYLDATNLSSDEDLQDALQIESYDIERLWTKLGNHATNEGVNIKLVLTQSSSGSTETKDLSFTVDGSYIAITNFIYAIEDDGELGFRIYNFKLVPYQDAILRGTFNVKDIRITQSSLSESLGNQIPEATQENTTTENKEKTEDNKKDNNETAENKTAE